MHTQKPSQGFTLVELIVILLLIGLLAGLASKSWTSLIASTRHTDVVNDAHRMFTLARSYAISQRTLTTVCPLSTSLTCTDDWSMPISIFPDADNNKRPDNGKIHRIFDLSKGHSMLYSRTAGRGYFQLAPSGMSHGTMGSLIVCSLSSDGFIEMSYLALNIGGRLRHQHDDDEDGAITLPWGTTLNCPKNLTI